MPRLYKQVYCLPPEKRPWELQMQTPSSHRIYSFGPQDLLAVQNDRLMTFFSPHGGIRQRS